MSHHRAMLGRRIRRTSWLVWILWAVVMLLPLSSTALRLIDWSVARPRNFWQVMFLVSGFGLYLTYPLVGALVAARQPRNPIGWLLSAVGLVLGVSNLAGSYALRGLVVAPGSLPGALGMAWLQSWLPFVWFPAIVLSLFVLFPDGRPPSRRWWIVVWMAILGGIGLIGMAIFQQRPLDAMNGPDVILSRVNPTAVGSPQLLQVFQAFTLFGVAAIVGAAAALIVRFRQSSGEQRQQQKWLVYVGTLLVAVLIVQSVFIGFGAKPVVAIAFQIWVLLYGVALPAAVGIAILKYRLYDIDLIINKSLVYGALAVFIGAVYVGVVVGLGRLIGIRGQPNLGLSIVSTAVVAIAFQPIRERLQRIVNRLLYGERATPYEAMADFANQIAGVLSLDEILPRIAEAAAKGLGATRAQVRQLLSSGGERVATWPASAALGRADYKLPVVYGGEQLGEIAVAKGATESLRPAERKLLADLVGQAGLVLHNVRLAFELQARLDQISAHAEEIRASRQRIVAAQDSQRHRLERTIHDGVEAQLAGIKAQFAQVEQLLPRAPDAGAALLEQLTSQTNAALEDLRDLARGIYPPLLAERGLATAIRAQVDKLRMAVDVTSDGIDRYPDEVEAAVYFSCLEALRCAQPPASVRLAAGDGALEFSIRASSIHLNGRAQEIEDRLEALGGSVEVGTNGITGRIPIPILEAVP